MALTDDVLKRFHGPSVWKESDCIAWLQVITGVQYDPMYWYQYTSEARALASACRRYGSYMDAVMKGLERVGYREIPRFAVCRFEYPDVVMVADTIHGVLPAGIGPAHNLLIRPPMGLTHAHGDILYYLRRD